MSRERAKGTAFETLVVDYLKAMGFPYAHRNPPAGKADVGDVGGIPGVVLELKNCQRMQLGEWMNEALAEAARAKAGIYAVVHKRRGRGNAAEQYVTMPLHVFAELIR